MIAMTIGLFVAAAAAQLFTMYLNGLRHLVLLARLDQDLSTTTDLVARHLRRAAFWNDAAAAVDAPAQSNPHASIDTPGTAGEVARYAFSRSAAPAGGGASSALPDADVRWQLKAGAIQLKLGSGNWEQLTDSETLRVTDFTITPALLTVPLGEACIPACLASDPRCPTMTIRSYGVEVRAHAVADAAVVRSLSQTVRVRNDEVPVRECP